MHPIHCLISVIVSLLPLMVTQNSNIVEIIKNHFLGTHIITTNFPQMILIISNRLHPTLLLVPIWNSCQLRNITIVTTDTDNGNIRCRLILFISCNSNISSCTTSYHNKYHGYGSYIVCMSIFQLKCLPYEYDVFTSQ